VFEPQILRRWRLFEDEGSTEEEILNSEVVSLLEKFVCMNKKARRGGSLSVLGGLRARATGQATIDAFIWIVAVFLAGAFRFEFNISQINTGPLLILGFVGALLFILAGKITSLHGSRFREASFDELVALALTTLIVAVPLSVVTFVVGSLVGVPRSLVFIASPIFFIGSGGIRLLRRFRRLTLSRQNKAFAKRVLIYGAGSMAGLLISQIKESDDSAFFPVGLLDDDPDKSPRWIAGVKTLGSFEDFETQVRKTRAESVIVAIPRATAELLQRVRDVSEKIGVEVLVLPSFSEILDSGAARIELHALGIEDLIGRRAVSINSASIDSYLRHKTVLITGAGGSIGIELCRQVARYQPRRLVFLDRDETGLQQAELAVSGSGLLDGADIILADIRDAENLYSVFSDVSPDVVFHAAALKHLPALEKFPQEAWKTNVIGTLNVLRASQANGVERFVNISTDKAAEATSVLGRTKKVAEELTSWFSEKYDGSYLSVRFGNVLGSRGSLVPTVASLINAGRPVTVTHRDATRYFMTTIEACQLVLQAGTETENGLVLILDMGQPVKIIDIVEKMISMSGKSASVIFSGLRKGEKLHESLSSQSEERTESSHELIWKIKAPPFDPALLINLRAKLGASGEWTHLT